MVKINESYIANEMRGSTEIKPQVQQTNAGLENLSKNSSVTLRQLSQVQENAARESAKNKELEFQKKSILEKLDSSLSGLAVDTVSKLVTIDFQNQQSKDKELADSYLSKEKTRTLVDFTNFYNENKTKAGKYGEGLFESTQDWINNRLLEIEKNAPNELAKHNLQDFAATFKVSGLEKAISDKQTIRNYSLISDIGDHAQILSNDPNSTFADIDGLEPQLIKTGVPRDQVEKAMTSIKENFAISKINQTLNSKDFELAKEMLDNPRFQTDISPTKLLATINRTEKLEEKWIKENNKKFKEASAIDRFEKNELTSLEAKDPDIKKYIENSVYHKSVALEPLLEVEPAAYIEGILDVVTKNPNVQLDAYNKVLSSGLQSEDPNKVLANAAVINKIKDDSKYNAVYSQLTEETQARATLITELAKVYSPQTTLNKVNASFNGKARDPDEVSKYTETTNKYYNKSGKSIYSSLYTSWYIPFEADPVNFHSIESSYKKSYKLFLKIPGVDDITASKLAEKAVLSEFQPSVFNSAANYTMDKDTNWFGAITENFKFMRDYDEIEKTPVEKFFTNKDFPFILNKMEEALIEKYPDAEIDMEKRTLKIGEDVKTFKLKAIPGITENQGDGNFVTYQIINGLPDSGGEVIIDQVHLPLNPYDKKSMEFWESFAKGEKTVSEKLAQQYKQLRDSTKTLLNTRP